MKPWDYSPDLTQDRLIVVGSLIAQARKSVFELYDERGDDSWSLGCRGFAWCRNAIIRLADSDTYPWLSVIDRSRRFIFRIGIVPIRFFRGDADEPFQKTLASASFEGEQYALKFPGENPGLNLIWRFVVETDFDGDFAKVFFNGATRNGIPECVWEVPLFEEDLKDLEDEAAVAPEEELPEPIVGLPGIDDAANE